MENNFRIKFNKNNIVKVLLRLKTDQKSLILSTVLLFRPF